MKKPLLWIFTSIAAGAALFLAVIWMMGTSNEAKKSDKIAETDGHSPDELKEEMKEQTGFIGGIKQTIQHDSIDSEDTALDILHKMTHQKVTAEDKWGAIPMTKANVLAAKQQISQLDIQDKKELVEILTKWEKEDFSQIDHDHNYFWSKQDGTIGKAYGIMTEEQEKAFIENNFRDLIEEE